MLTTANTAVETGKHLASNSLSSISEVHEGNMKTFSAVSQYQHMPYVNGGAACICLMRLHAGLHAFALWGCMLVY